MINTEEIINMRNRLFSEGSRYGYERTETLLKLLGNPDQGIKLIHIAGTNGKGSVSRMLSSILISAGYRVGAFNSPYLNAPNEYLCINGCPDTTEVYADYFNRAYTAASSMSDMPTEFEISFAAAMLYYQDKKCDAAVIECGLGGLNDATNAIHNPILCILTNIGLDHTSLLGNTVEEIALQKSGIIKAGAKVVAYPVSDSVSKIIESACELAEKDLKPVISDFSKLNIINDDIDAPGRFSYKTNKIYELSLKGRYQFNNAAVVLDAVDALRCCGLTISDKAILTGLTTVQWPARFEIISHNPPVILDGGHNPQCAMALADSLTNYNISDAVFVFGAMADKNINDILDSILPFAKTIIATEPDNARRIDADSLINLIKDRAKQLSLCDIKIYKAEKPSEAFERALVEAKESHPVIVTGSLYMMGEIRQCLTHFTAKKKPR